MGREVDHAPDTRLGVVLALVLGACALGPAVWALTVRDRLPTEVARHWGLDGTPTATWSLTTQLWALALVTLLAAGVTAAIAVLARLPLTMRRILAGASAWIAVLFAVLQVGGLVTQLDLADGLDAGPIGGGIALGSLGGLVVGAIVGMLAREQPHRRLADAAPPPDAPRLAGSEDEADGSGGEHLVDDLVWRSQPMTSRALVWVGGVTTVLLLAAALPAGLLGVGALLWSTALVLAALTFGMARLRVTIDASGLSVRAPGVRVLHLPIEEIARADVLPHVDPFWEFGGWGLRVDVRGRVGVVSRKGEALDVRRADGSEVVLTVDHAHEAAATLNTLLDRHHATR